MMKNQQLKCAERKRAELRVLVFRVGSHVPQFAEKGLGHEDFSQLTSPHSRAARLGTVPMATGSLEAIAVAEPQILKVNKNK